MVDQRTPDPLALQPGIDEQRIQVDIAVRSRLNGRKSNHLIAYLCHKHQSARYLLLRDDDGVRMGQQGFAISRIVERSTPLQRLQQLPFTDVRASDR